MGRKLGQAEVIIVMDLAIYAKAQEIVWKQTGEFSNVVLRVGAFHTAMTFITVRGKRFGDAGLSDLFIEAGIVALGSVTQTCHLTPTKDALKYHVARANYQACIWNQCLEATAPTPSPDGHGWVLKDGHLTIHWMDQQPAPKALLQLISCKCRKDHCAGGKCSCRQNTMPCTDACGCTNCTNAGTHRGFSDDDNDD